ncbi:MAG: hypothetical protein HQL32_14990 [Planctomycetes bacterium]|nr:hypothetical protein [Planctomycetota bacterium]
MPAAIWWPGTIDKNSAAYADKENTYDGFVGYIDIYPTLMAPSGPTCQAKGWAEFSICSP